MCYFQVTEAQTEDDILSLGLLVEGIFELKPMNSKMSYCTFLSYHFVDVTPYEVTQQDLASVNQDLLRWVSEDITTDNLGLHLKQVHQSTFDEIYTPFLK